MFDLGWSELLVIGAVALVVLGPKELPNALRTISNLTKTARKLANEFQSGVNEIVREADLEDARKAAQSISRGGVSKAIEKAVDPTGDLKTTIKGVESEAKSAAVPASAPKPALGPAPAPTPVPAPEPDSAAAAAAAATATPTESETASAPALETADAKS